MVKNERQVLIRDLPFAVREFELLLHQELHYHLSRIGDRCTGAEDGGDTGFVEEVVVLRGDDTTGSDEDILTA